MATRKRKAEPEAPAMTCEHCRHFKPSASHNECRANPPAVVPDLSDGGMMSVFPMVGPGEWCGFWAAKLNS